MGTGRHGVLRRWFRLIPILMLVSPSAARAQNVTVDAARRVSVVADGVPVGTLLAQFAALTALDLRIDPNAALRPVTIRLDAVALESALENVLTASGLDYAVTGLYRARRSTPIRAVVAATKRSRPSRVSGGMEKATPLSVTGTVPRLVPKVRERGTPDAGVQTLDVVSGSIAVTHDLRSSHEQELFNALVAPVADATLAPPAEQVISPVGRSAGEPVMVPTGPTISPVPDSTRPEDSTVPGGRTKHPEPTKNPRHR